ncbi:MAG: hypothetical protein KIT58_04375 [Planctomycetota bacterium]|nr:hypothetical protein [Planctomycetota bacterium]
MRYRVHGSADTVDFWSEVRIPFEPRGAAVAARDELRASLRALRPTGELTAVYTARDRAFCDIENVLLYNVGPGTFSGLTEHRLLLLRQFQDPTPPTPELPLPHHHRYTTRGTAGTPWRRQRELGRRRFALPGSALRPAAVWLAARRAAEQQDLGLQATGPLGLDLELELPRNARLQIASSLKPLLDGVVCAFHTHDGTGDVRDLSERITRSLGGTADAEEVLQLLTTGPCELGARALVRPWRDGVQWNPADDALVQVDVRVLRSDVTAPECRVQVHELVPVAG